MERPLLISRNLKKINHLYTKILSKELALYEMDQHFEALYLLGMQNQPITQNSLAELMQIDKSRMAVIIFVLEKKGLIQVKINPDDRRQHYVNLSSSAKTSIPALEKTIEKINQQAKAGIPEEKLLAFFEVSEMMRQNLLRSES
jgi:DNA-binding MarR family transcriptional regulator